MTPDRPRSSRSLQDLRHIRSELQALRDQEKAREQALAQQRLQQQAQRNQFASAVGAVQPLRGDHARRVLHRPEPVSPQPRQRERDHAAVLHEALSDAIDTSSLLETDDQLSYKRPEIGDDVLRKLRRGHWSTQAEIDLHGLRQRPIVTDGSSAAEPHAPAQMPARKTRLVWRRS